MAKQKIPVSKRALMQRINRQLLKNDEQLLTARGAAAEQAYGRFFIVDQRRNQAIEGDVDLEAKGRELGVLAPWECLADKEA